MASLMNIYTCLIPPLLLMLFILKGENRILNFFLIIGMTSCLAAAYSNKVIIGLTDYSFVQATYYITPILEETIKALPILLYIIIFKPKRDAIITAALATGIGFATFENCYYIMIYGASDSVYLMIRGFSAGIMHGLCTAIIGFGFGYIHKQRELAIPGTFGLLCASITYHATYNLLISSTGVTLFLGIFLPIATAAICLFIIYKPYQIIIKKIKREAYVEK